MAYKRKYNRRFKKSRRGNARRTRKGTRTTFNRRVKKVLMRTAETKELEFAFENQQLYHNTGVAGSASWGPLMFNSWNQIAQGSGKQQRVGDTIQARGMKLRLWIANKFDRPNVMYRLIVVVLPKTYNNARVTSGSIDIFAPSFTGANGNAMCLPIDTEKGIRTLYDRTFNLQMGTSGTLLANKECHMVKRLFIKSKGGTGSTVKFESNISQDIVNRPMAIYLIPYDSYGTLITDNIASCAWFATMLWKDI